MLDRDDFRILEALEEHPRPFQGIRHSLGYPEYARYMVALRKRLEYLLRVGVIRKKEGPFTLLYRITDQGRRSLEGERRAARHLGPSMLRPAYDAWKNQGRVTNETGQDRPTNT